MNKRIAWLVVSSLMVLSLMLASCAPKVTEEKKAVAEEKVVTEEKKAVAEEKKVVAEEKKAVAKAEVPRYGGTLTRAERDETNSSLDVFNPTAKVGTSKLAARMYDGAVVYDRTKGPAGTGEWLGQITWSPIASVGAMAERWEIIQPDTIIVHIRKRVRFHDKPPVNGREVTPEDWLFSYKRAYEAPTWPYWRNTYGFLSDTKNVANSIYISPEDPWALVVKALPEYLGTIWEGAISMIQIVPKEYEGMPGGTPQRWQDIVGTGPFILTDWVRGSSRTYERNPNYYRKDQFHPENQLPYIDVYKEVIIPDLSTAISAMRTGKIDQLGSASGITLGADDAEGLIRTNPELLWYKYPQGGGRGPAMHMRWDVKPFDDVRVRQAMMMAINHPEIVKDYYKGNAILYYWPAVPGLSEHKDYVVPLEQMPQVVQDMFGYHPDKAAKLLDAAGYPGPNRFTTSVTVSAAMEEYLDLAAIVKSYWAKVGVTLEIDVKEAAVWEAMGNAKTHKNGYFRSTSNQEPYKWVTTKKGIVYNYAMVYTPIVEETFAKVQAAYLDPVERARIVREATPEIASLAPLQILPLPYDYTMWQPWLKAYNGESTVDYLGGQGWTAYIWIDQALKEQLTGRR
ncbi:MAG: ABC transporter substrate-binding protein [Chloroflexi bacterium]|nr:ABC transporter substrate-binding protein [Chloroflexota bacterium]